jgi:hypothetical protein
LTTAKQGKADLLEIPLKRAERSDFKVPRGCEKILQKSLVPQKIIAVAHPFICDRCVEFAISALSGGIGFLHLGVGCIPVCAFSFSWMFFL